MNAQALADAAEDTPPRPAVIQLTIREKAALQASYIALFADGGIFVASARPYTLGQEVYLLLTLPDDPQRYPIVGQVAWITPAGASGLRTQGIGVRFPRDERGRALKARIEALLDPLLPSDQPTQTV
ncbi:hypothetical protein Talka_00399 [Tepidimonas alkaliphilus]|uniref:PilZ domain-containing protein n=1 Tax=Tepidimonas alkaliphilus TaxID=2588942 RepID=A0A554WDR1_9BURK|nr:PilZ domain-containing protein [Tepidimonas alkaliphilus]TSE21719.1 hypothetical protein Talka_00399 [Tepidimonas alkaliphilus]